MGSEKKVQKKPSGVEKANKSKQPLAAKTTADVTASLDLVQAFLKQQGHDDAAGKLKDFGEWAERQATKQQDAPEPMDVDESASSSASDSDASSDSDSDSDSDSSDDSSGSSSESEAEEKAPAKKASTSPAAASRPRCAARESLVFAEGRRRGRRPRDAGIEAGSFERGTAGPVNAYSAGSHCIGPGKWEKRARFMQDRR